MASVVTPDPALPIEPASVLLPVLAPPSAIVRAWLLPCSVTGPVSVKTTAPEPADSMKVTPADKVTNRLVVRSEEHTSEFQSLLRMPYAVLFLTKIKTLHITHRHHR